MLGNERLSGRDGVTHNLRQIDALLSQFDQPPGEAGNFEKVIYKSDQMAHLARHDVMHPRRFGVVDARSQDVQAIPDWRKWIAQFVGQHGQELVLTTVGVAQRFLSLPQRLDFIERGHDYRQAFPPFERHRRAGDADGHRRASAMRRATSQSA